jgi:hypothetical protein
MGEKEHKEEGKEKTPPHSWFFRYGGREGKNKKIPKKSLMNKTNKCKIKRINE